MFLALLGALLCSLLLFAPCTIPDKVWQWIPLSKPIDCYLPDGPGLTEGMVGTYRGTIADIMNVLQKSIAPRAPVASASSRKG